jgi:hypothetical protein
MVNVDKWLLDAFGWLLFMFTCSFLLTSSNTAPGNSCIFVRNSKMLVVKTSKISGTATDDVTLFFGRHETIISSMSSGQQSKHVFSFKSLEYSG